MSISILLFWNMLIAILISLFSLSIYFELKVKKTEVEEMKGKLAKSQEEVAKLRRNNDFLTHTSCLAKK